MKGVWKDGFKKNLKDNILYISKEAYFFSKRKPKVVKEDEIYRVENEKFYIKDRKYYYKNRLIPDYLLSSVSSRGIRKKSWKKLYSGRERTAARNVLSLKPEESPEIKHNKSSVLWDIF